MSIVAKPVIWPIRWTMHPTVAYSVTSDGKILRHDGGRTASVALILDEDGYLYAQVLVAVRKRVKLRVHQAVCTAFNGPRPSPAHVTRHFDGVKTNNVPTNLKWGTVAENSADAVRLGELAKGTRNGAYTQPAKRRFGEANGLSKLTALEAVSIFNDPRPQSAVAADYGVNQTLVSAIKVGRIWHRATGAAPHQTVLARQAVAEGRA